MITFSANLGFLWTDRSLPDAIGSAHAAGFDAVECHMPYDQPVELVCAALADTGLSMVTINTRLGSRDGDLGVAAIPGREVEARRLIDEAIDYAVAIGCPRVSVVAGRSGRTAEAEATYRTNLSYAAEQAAPVGCTVLIEPLNTSVADDYHLVDADAGVTTIDAVGAPNLKLMLDCFHTAKMHGDVKSVIDRVVDHIGHIQIAAFPDRGEPVGGDIDYATLLPHIAAMGYDQPFGAEYTPRGDIDSGLTWLEPWHASRRHSTGAPRS